MVGDTLKPYVSKSFISGYGKALNIFGTRSDIKLPDGNATDRKMLRSDCKAVGSDLRKVVCSYGRRGRGKGIKSIARK